MARITSGCALQEDGDGPTRAEIDAKKLQIQQVRWGRVARTAFRSDSDSSMLSPPVPGLQYATGVVSCAVLCGFIWCVTWTVIQHHGPDHLGVRLNRPNRLVRYSSIAWTVLAGVCAVSVIEPRPTAAIAMANPYCSCKRTAAVS